MLSSVFAWTEYAPPRRTSDSVFDNSVERASREKSFGHKSERSHKIDHSISQEIRVAAIPAFEPGDGSLPTTRRQASGFKREFDPGSESTLAACLTHASRTRKWSNP
jgi:hypothetical protein